MPASLRLRAAALLALVLFCGAGHGATTCSLAAGNLAFGAYDVFAVSSLDSTASLVVTCNRVGGPQHIMVSIAIGPSASSSSVQNRRMQSVGGSDFLRYNLFRDATRTAVWGNTQGIDTFAQTISVPNNGSAQMAGTIFGRIPAGQDVRVGSYADTVMVTVTP